MEKVKQKSKKKQKSITNSFIKAIKSFSTLIPVLLGIILLMGFFRAFVSERIISSMFTGEVFRDTLIGTLIGSIFAGNAINSYIIGGELLNMGVTLFAVTAFIVAWVTVGIIQCPAEMEILGRRFATVRNLLNFILVIIVSIATVLTLMVIK